MATVLFVLRFYCCHFVYKSIKVINNELFVYDGFFPLTAIYKTHKANIIRQFKELGECWNGQINSRTLLNVGNLILKNLWSSILPA